MKKVPLYNRGECRVMLTYASTKTAVIGGFPKNKKCELQRIFEAEYKFSKIKMEISKIIAKQSLFKLKELPLFFFVFFHIYGGLLFFQR